MQYHSQYVKKSNKENKMKCKLLFLFHSDHQLLSEVLLSRKDLINADFQVLANDFISSETTEQTNKVYIYLVQIYSM